MATKKKGGFFQRLIIGTDKAEGYARASLPSNRWELFWDIFKGRFWKLVLLNLIAVVAFLAPLIVLFMRTNIFSVYGSSYPYSSGIGGYPFYPDIDLIGQSNILAINLQFFLMLIPALVISGLLLSGVFYVMRNMVWSEGIFLSNDYFKGLKSNALMFMLIMLLEGIVIFLTAMSNTMVAYYNFLGQGSIWLSLSAGISIVFAVFYSIMSLYMMTMTVTYKLNFFQLLKNAFLFTFGLFFQNVFFFALCVAPLLLYLIIPSLLPIIIIVYLFIGFIGGILGWTVFNQWVFDKFVNDKVEGAVKDRGIYQKVDINGVPIKKAVKTSKIVRKKPLKPVNDEEITLELPVTFTRADLQRLAEEKERMAQDAARWSEEHEDDPEILGNFTVYDADEEIITEDGEVITDEQLLAEMENLDGEQVESEQTESKPKKDKKKKKK